MGFFDLFKKKKRQSSELNDFLNKFQQQMFPGGKQEMIKQVEDLRNLLGNKYDNAAIGGTLCYMTSLMFVSKEKSAERVVKHGSMLRPDNKFSESDAMVIYKYVVRKVFERFFGTNNELAFQGFYKSIGNIEGGVTTDEIPGGYGEFGLCVTNPVPVRGIPANKLYLGQLRLLSGEDFTWKRIGSFGADNIKNPIDGYQITTKSGIDLCCIYISPYQNTISNKAPKGFYIKK